MGLSFIKDGRWAPSRTGRYTEDTATGKRYAEELLAEIQKQQNPLALNTVVRSIVEGGEYSGVETGLFIGLGCQIFVRG